MIVRFRLRGYGPVRVPSVEATRDVAMLLRTSAGDGARERLWLAWRRRRMHRIVEWQSIDYGEADDRHCDNWMNVECWNGSAGTFVGLLVLTTPCPFISFGVSRKGRGASALLHNVAFASFVLYVMGSGMRQGPVETSSGGPKEARSQLITMERPRVSGPSSFPPYVGSSASGLATWTIKSL